MKKSIVVLFLVLGVLFIQLFSQSANAGKEGHGGDGVLIDGVPYVLDLVEIAQYKNPYFRDANYYDVEIKNFIRNHLDIADEDAIYIAAKLMELKFMAPIYYFQLLTQLKQMDWFIVNRSLKDVKDEDTVFEFSEGELVQLAIRRSFKITIDQTLWDKMSPKNRCALIFHELNYSLLPYRKIEENVGTEIRSRYVQYSQEARYLTALLFSDKFSDCDSKCLLETVQRYGISQQEDSEDSINISPYILRFDDNDEELFILKQSISNDGHKIYYVNFYVKISRRNLGSELLPLVGRLPFCMDDAIYSIILLLLSPYNHYSVERIYNLLF